jgi:hypothetical protein
MPTATRTTSAVLELLHVGEFLGSDASSFARRFWARAHTSTSTSSGAADKSADCLLRPEAAQGLARLPDNSLFALFQHHPALADTDAPASLVERIRLTAPPGAARSAVALLGALPPVPRARSTLMNASASSAQPLLRPGA